jgi:hypothetical protein
METPSNSSPERGPVAYVGPALMLIGILLFLSTFVTAIANFGNFDNFEGRVKSMGFRALGGMVLFIVGGVVTGATGKGAASSRMMQNLSRLRDQVQINVPKPEPQPVLCQYCNTENDASLAKCESCGAALVKQCRCFGCGTVNDPNARFCNHCGKAIA